MSHSLHTWYELLRRNCGWLVCVSYRFIVGLERECSSPAISAGNPGWRAWWMVVLWSPTTDRPDVISARMSQVRPTKLESVNGNEFTRTRSLDSEAFINRVVAACFGLSGQCVCKLGRAWSGFTERSDRPECRVAFERSATGVSCAASARDCADSFRT